MDSKENRKKLRLRLAQPLDVKVASIGSQLIYELVTEDISMAGFFLAFSAPSRFPFLASSILEVWLKLPDGQELFFNGMMARIVHNVETDDQLRKGIAIRIVQIEPEVKQALQYFIEQYAHEHNLASAERAASGSNNEPPPLEDNQPVALDGAA